MYQEHFNRLSFFFLISFPWRLGIGKSRISFRIPPLFSFYIKISFFVIVYKSYHFCWSSLLSFFTPLVLLVSQLDLALLSSCFLITLPPEVQNPQALAHLERAKLLSELLWPGSGVGCVHSAGAESQHPSGGHSWLPTFIFNGGKDLVFTTNFFPRFYLSV
jgi:hypothetical protein